MMLDELRRTAEARGIATSFTDAASRHYEVSEATLRAVLDAMGPAPDPTSWPPVVVTRTGRGGTDPPPAGPSWGSPDPSPGWRPPEGEPVSLVLEGGEERPLPAEPSGDLPPGRHLVVGRSGATTLVVAPGRCHLPPALEGGGRAWGWAAQLYAARSRSSWGIGDLGDLAGLLTATAPLGAGFALLNPLHAALPTEPSPYNPSSRVFRNPLYLRVGDVPELAGLDPDGRARVEALAGAGRDLLDRDRIDRPAVYQLKDAALRLAHGALGRLPARRAGLAGHLPPSRPPRGGGVRRAAPRRGELPRLAPVAAGGAAGRRAVHSWRAGGAQRPGHRLRPQRLRRLVVPGRAGRRHLGRRPARPAGPARPGLGPAGVRPRPDGRRRLRAIRPDHPGRHGPCRRPAHRPRDGAVPAVLDPGGGRAGPGHLRPLPGRRPAGRPGPGERGRPGPGRRRGPGHGRARGAGAAGRRGGAVLPAGLVRAGPRRRPAPGGRLPAAGPGRDHHPRPAHRGRGLHRQRPGAPVRHRGGHARRGRPGRPGGAAGQPVPAAGGRGPAGPGRAVGPGDRGRPVRLPRPDPGDAGRGHPRGRAGGPRPAQRPRHHRPAPQLVAAPARPARRPGRRPPGPAPRRDPLGGDDPGDGPKL